MANLNNLIEPALIDLPQNSQRINLIELSRLVWQQRQLRIQKTHQQNRNMKHKEDLTDIIRQIISDFTSAES